MAHGHHGGHHHGGRGWWGGGWGWPGWGYGWPYAYPYLYPAGYPAVGPGAVLVGQDVPASATMLPPPSAAMVPSAPASMVGPGSYGPTTQAGTMAQVVALRGGGMCQNICPLGVHRKKVKKHHTTTVVARPQVLYKVRQLVIPSHVARHFEIKSIRVGLQEFLVSRAGIPADVFSNKSFVPFVINLPGPILPGQCIYIRVKNTSRHKKWFRAAFDGIALS